MTAAYSLAACWGFVLLVSLIGYGRLLRRLLFPTERVGWAESAAWGIAFIIALGGWLNLAGIISPALIISLIGLGVAFTTFEVLMQKSSYCRGLQKPLASSQARDRRLRFSNWLV